MPRVDQIEADSRPAVRSLVAQRLLITGATGVLAVLLWLMWVIRFRPWVAHNDFAVMRVALERMLDGHFPTVGTYSRLGVYHPGPLREWVFVLPYALGGGRAATLPATALLLNIGWVVACTWLALRCLGGGCRIAVMAGVTLLVVGLGPNLASAWNPHLAILPLYAACWSVTLLWRAGARNTPLALLAVAATSFAGQMHASALPVAGLLLTAAVGLPIAREWPRFGWRSAAPLGLSLLLWSGVLVDLRRGGSSNLVNLAQAGSGSTLGVGDALGLVSRLLWPPTGVTGLSIRPSAASLTGFSRMWAVALVVALAATSMLAFRRRSGPEHVRKTFGRVTPGEAEWIKPVQAGSTSSEQVADLVWRSAVVALALIVVAILTVAAFVPPPFRYLFGPLQAVSVFALAVLVAWPLHALGQQLPQPPTLIALSCFCFVMFVVVPIDDHESAARRRLGIDAAVDQFLEEHPDRSTIHVIGLDMVGASVQDEVAVIAYRAGREIRSSQFGLHLPAPTGQELVLAAAMGESYACLLADPAAHPVLTGLIGESPFGIFGLDVRSAQELPCAPDQRNP